MARSIVFLSDFGLQDEFVGVCHGMIARLAPDAPVIDLTHGIPPGDVVRAATVLADSLPFMPEDAVYLAVVDPGVGSSRRPIAVELSAGVTLVGPDNGILSLAWVDGPGVPRAHEISADGVRSDTFHGRDVFAPAAARLAAGAPLEDLGPALDPSSVVRLEAPRATFREGRAMSPVLAVDRFGNVQLAMVRADLARLGAGGPPGSKTDRVMVRVGGVDAHLPVARTFADVPPGAPFVFVDSTGRVALAVNGASAAERYAVAPGDIVVLGPGIR